MLITHIQTFAQILLFFLHQFCLGLFLIHQILTQILSLQSLLLHLILLQIYSSIQYHLPYPFVDLLETEIFPLICMTITAGYSLLKILLHLLLGLVLFRQVHFILWPILSRTLNSLLFIEHFHFVSLLFLMRLLVIPIGEKPWQLKLLPWKLIILGNLLICLLEKPPIGCKWVYKVKLKIWWFTWA